MWYEVMKTGQSEACVVFAQIRVPADSPWFCGHFPGEPILPGIAQLGMVFDAIAQASNRKLKIRSVSRVRFKKAIRPNDHLTITAARQEDGKESYQFRIMLQEEVVCSGVMGLQE
jgi:3-hydroxymyristoyl/3-hydroxydecanoyl-(acyl carrier protein) dehydratase